VEWRGRGKGEDVEAHREVYNKRERNVDVNLIFCFNLVFFVLNRTHMHTHSLFLHIGKKNLYQNHVSRFFFPLAIVLVLHVCSIYVVLLLLLLHTVNLSSKETW
jgi:hypothetical protein